jgi:hypothetical protein
MVTGSHLDDEKGTNITKKYKKDMLLNVDLYWWNLLTSNYYFKFWCYYLMKTLICSLCCNDLYLKKIPQLKLHLDKLTNTASLYFEE